MGDILICRAEVHGWKLNTMILLTEYRNSYYMDAYVYTKLATGKRGVHSGSIIRTAFRLASKAERVLYGRP